MLADRRLVGRLAATIAVAGLLALAFLAGRGGSTTTSSPMVPGPYRVIDGITVGFARSPAGAQAAAAHSLLELERVMDKLSAQRTSLVAHLVATAGEASAISEHARSVIAIERDQGAPLRRVAIATDQVSYTPSAAQETVLEEWIYATSAREALWAVERVGLVWRHGGWRISSISGAAPSADESLDQLRAQLQFPGAGDASVR